MPSFSNANDFQPSSSKLTISSFHHSRVNSRLPPDVIVNNLPGHELNLDENNADLSSIAYQSQRERSQSYDGKSKKSQGSYSSKQHVEKLQ
jgi:hypothetical protein